MKPFDGLCRQLGDSKNWQSFLALDCATIHENYAGPA